jgi:hypothetical protein
VSGLRRADHSGRNGRLLQSGQDDQRQCFELVVFCLRHNPLGQLTHSFLSPPAPQLVEVNLAALLPEFELTHPLQLAYRLWSFIADVPELRSSADVFSLARCRSSVQGHLGRG